MVQEQITQQEAFIKATEKKRLSKNQKQKKPKQKAEFDAKD